MEFREIEKEQIKYEEALKHLKLHDVFLAEFECLYDDDPKMFGQIDPNALSAGGFPVLFLRGVLDEFHKYQLTKISWYNEDDFNSVYARLKKALSSKFKFNERILHDVSMNAADKIGEMFIYDIPESVLNCLDVGIANLDLETLTRVNANFSNHLQACNTLFANKYSICYLHNDLWTYYRLNLIKNLDLFSHKGGSFNTFTNLLLKKIFEFSKSFVTSTGVLDNLTTSDKRIVSDYKVSWESDLGYIAKYIIEKNYPNVHINILHDLHAKTNLFIPMPLLCYMEIMNSKRATTLYDLMLNYNKSRDAFNYELIHTKKEFPKISYNKKSKECIINFDANTQLHLRDCLTSEDSLTQYYIQYAYLFKDFPMESFEMNKKCDRVMFLSSFLNAKAALFKIYEEVEQTDDIYIERPPTKLCFDNPIKVNDYQDFVTENKLIVKEGGKCSTGGSEVDFIDVSTVNEYRTSYLRPVIQKYVPSYIFKHAGDPVHSHVRKISIIDNKGNVCHLGYVFKISYRGKTNSSGFVTITLCFDDSGEFIYGIEIGKKTNIFYNLSDADLELNIKKENLSKFLASVKLNWTKATLTLNKYFEENFKERVNALVEAKVIDKVYLLQ